MEGLKKVAVIGSGFAGMSAATFLAQKGVSVDVYEKNAHPGGRAQWFEEAGFMFDMGPSWYWMPDVFERYFAEFGKKPSDYYQLERLSPSYQVVYGKGESLVIPANLDELYALFEKLETGSAKKLEKFLAEAAYKYDVAIQDLVYKPGKSIFEFADWRVFKALFRLDLFTPISKHIRAYFKHPHLIALLEFPVLFLGAKPSKTPAMYSLMNYADMQLGTWYPVGGMRKVAEGMFELAKEKGVQFHFNTPVTKLNPSVKGIEVQNGQTNAHYDFVVAAGDYHHTEQQLLDQAYRSYSPQYWDTRVMAPSSLIFYIGLNKKADKLLHHTLFFDEDFGQHATEIYDQPQWPSKPLFYVCCPSKTDDGVAPMGKENMFILVPVAPDLEDTKEERELIFKRVWARLEAFVGEPLMDQIVFKRSYAHRDFINDYHSFKGNAYGLANTLMQTAILKPSIQSKKVKNLFYAGQLTVPGPGVPPSLISGRLAANEILNLI
jgi:phytoene desaturase